jgi:hypothetical protein
MPLLLLRRFLLTTATHCKVKPLISAAAAADPHSAPNLFFFFFYFFFTPLQNVAQKLQFPGTSRAVGSRLTATAEFPFHSSLYPKNRSKLPRIVSLTDSLSRHRFLQLTVRDL